MSALQCPAVQLVCCYQHIQAALSGKSTAACHRPALPDLFRQEGAFTFLQPALASDLSFAQLHSHRDSQPPVLLVNLQAFLAEKLQTADRCFVPTPLLLTECPFFQADCLQDGHQNPPCM